MKWFEFHGRRTVLWASLVTITGANACRRDVSAAEMTPGASAPAASEPGASSPASAQFDEAAFSLRIEPSGPYAVGKPCLASVHLAAKGAHHVNQEYPHKFKLRSEEGVRYPQPVVGRESMKIEAKRADFTVPFTPSRTGKLTISGEFAFSLCTADRCLIEKRSLALDVEAF
jgi:hypothetical protein